MRADEEGKEFGLISDFLHYSIKNKCKIAVLFLKDGKMERKNLTVLSEDPDTGTFLAVPAGRKKEVRFFTENVLTCDYARGDHGELE